MESGVVCPCPRGVIRAGDGGPECKSFLEGVVGGKDPELVGLHVKGVLRGKLWTISKN